MLGGVVGGVDSCARELAEVPLVAWGESEEDMVGLCVCGCTVNALCLCLGMQNQRAQREVL